MKTQEPFVITLSREVGSGGHTVGRILAEKLNVRYCDKMLLECLQKQFGLTASEIERLKGEKKNWLADFIKRVAPVPPADALGQKAEHPQEFSIKLTTDRIFEAEAEILREFASMGSCVIAGRSGFFIFKDCPNTLNVFITASKPQRIKRIMQKQGLSEESAAALIEGIDQARENYTRRFAGVSRFDARNYDLVLKADGHSEEQLADIILSYFEGSF